MSDDTSHNKAVKHLYPKTSGEQNFYAMHRWETPNDKFLDPNNGVFHIASKVFNRKANHYGHDMADSIAAYDKVVTRDSDEFEPEFHESEENPFMKKYLGEATPVGVKKKSLDEKAHYAVTKKGFRHVVAFKKPQKKPVTGLAVNPHEYVKEPIKEISNSLLARYHTAADKDSDNQQDKISKANSILANGKSRLDKIKTLQDRSNAGFKLAKRTFGMKDAESKLAKRGLHPDQVKEGTDDGSERMGHVGTDMMAPIQLQKGVQKKMKLTGKPPVNVNPLLKQAKGPAYGSGFSPDGYVGSFNEISSEVLGRYIKKASARVGNDTFNATREGTKKNGNLVPNKYLIGKAQKHLKGIQGASDRLTSMAQNYEIEKKKGTYDTNESVGEMKVKVFRTFNKYRGGKVPGQKKASFNDSSSQVADLQKTKTERVMEAVKRSKDKK